MKKALLFALLAMFSVSSGFAQAADEVVDVNDDVLLVQDDDSVLDSWDEVPEFPGGQAGLMKYLSENVKYPEVSYKNRSQGRVITRLVVSKDGSVGEISLIKSSGDMYLDREAVRVIAAMPKWKPAIKDGRAVCVSYVLPVVFRLK